jgi:Fe-S oxidoreductase
VVLFVDTFTDHFAPETGIAAVRALEHAGYRVILPDRPVCCGLTLISTGRLDAARRRLRRTLGTLLLAATTTADAHAEQAGDAARAGVPSGAPVPIVGLEPSCTAVLRSDSRDLLGPADPAATTVAGATRTLAEVLTATPGWVPPDLSGLRALAQPHCHHHAVLGWDTDAALLGRAGAEVRTVGGCCGLAGNFGVERGHYEVSVAVAETALLPAVREADDQVVMLADGFSCRTQLEQLAGRHGMHLAELLAGRLPPGA